MNQCVDYLNFLSGFEAASAIDSLEQKSKRPVGETNCGNAWINLVESFHNHAKQNLSQCHYKHSLKRMHQYIRYMILYIHAAAKGCNNSTKWRENILNVEDMQSDTEFLSLVSSLTNDYVATRVYDIGLLPYLEWPLFLPNEQVAESYGDVCQILSDDDANYIMSHPILHRIKEYAAAHVALVNDIISVDKELEHNDVNNYVLIRANIIQEECIEKALIESIDYTNNILANFIEDEKRFINHLNIKFDNNPVINKFTNQYFKSIHEWIDGNIEWHLTVERYSHKILTH